MRVVGVLTWVLPALAPRVWGVSGMDYEKCCSPLCAPCGDCTHDAQGNNNGCDSRTPASGIPLVSVFHWQPLALGVVKYVNWLNVAHVLPSLLAGCFAMCGVDGYQGCAKAFFGSLASQLLLTTPQELSGRPC